MLHGGKRRAICRDGTVAEAFLARYLLPVGDKEVSLYIHKFKQLEAERCPVISSSETILPLGRLYIHSGRHRRPVKKLEGRPKASNGARLVMKRQMGTRI